MRDRHPTTCTACGTQIERGEDYIADVRQHERIGRFGLIKVLAAADVAPRHSACAPTRNRPAPVEAAVRDHTSTRTTIAVLLASAAGLYLTRGLTVPVWVLFVVIVAASYLTCRAYTARDRAIVRADQQQRRADILAAPRMAPTIAELLHTGPRDQLIGHDDRDQVIARLGDRYATGHLTAGEFETRSTRATQARTRGQLAAVLRDLP